MNNNNFLSLEVGKNYTVRKSILHQKPIPKTITLDMAETVALYGAIRLALQRLMNFTQDPDSPCGGLSVQSAVEAARTLDWAHRPLGNIIELILKGRRAPMTKEDARKLLDA